MPTVTASLIGVNLNAYDSTAQFAKGTQVNTSDGGIFEYVNTLSAIAAYNAVGIDEEGNASNLTTTLAATVKKVAVAQISIAVSTYGWVQRQGKMGVNVAAQCQDFVPLFTTSTPGVLDDVTVSECLVLGLNTYSSTVTASNVSALGAAPLQIFPFANPA